jgi:hypothetical protein
VSGILVLCIIQEGQNLIAQIDLPEAFGHCTTERVISSKNVFSNVCCGRYGYDCNVDTYASMVGKGTSLTQEEFDSKML